MSKKYFDDYAIRQQDFLGEEEQINKVLALIPVEGELCNIDFIGGQSPISHKMLNIFIKNLYSVLHNQTYNHMSKLETPEKHRVWWVLSLTSYDELLLWDDLNKI